MIPWWTVNSSSKSHRAQARRRDRFRSKTGALPIGEHHGIRNARQNGSPGFETLFRNHERSGMAEDSSRPSVPASKYSLDMMSRSTPASPKSHAGPVRSRSRLTKYTPPSRLNWAVSWWRYSGSAHIQAPPAIGHDTDSSHAKRSCASSKLEH